MLLALLSAAAHAAFPGGNGAIVYGYNDGSNVWDDQLGDANYVEKSIHALGRYDSRFITGCTEIYLSDSACERQSF